jgi:glycosyltransferase involved in cell wall biosynthesis
MEKLRIAVWHNLPSGGGKRQLYYHVKGLRERGHYLESWCPDTADQKFLPLSDLIEEHVIPLKIHGDNFHNPLRPYKETRGMIWSIEDHCRACAEEINRGDFDILYANACMYMRTTPIGKFVGIPSALYLGEPYRWFYEAMPELPWIAPRQQLDEGVRLSNLRELIRKYLGQGSMRLQARAELEYARAFDLILSNSVYSRESILRAYELDSRVCYLGVDTDYYRPTGEKKENFVVGLGTIYRGKGIDRAIRAIGAIGAARRPRLVWIGNGASERDLQKYIELAKQLDVDFESKIHIPDHEVISYLSRARVMIYTSRLEPFGLAPLEANACCTPVVGIAEGGVRETIRDDINGYLALNDDPQAIADLIMKIIDAPAAAQEMGKAARRYVEENWNLEFGTDNIENALLALLEKRGGTRILKGDYLHGLQPTKDIRMHLEQREFKEKRLVINGWGFIDDGGGARNSSVFLMIQDRENRRVVPMKSLRRTDITSHFGGAIDYDNCGFSLECTVGEENPEFGVIIIRDGKVAFRYLSPV